MCHASEKDREEYGQRDQCGTRNFAKLVVFTITCHLSPYHLSGDRFHRGAGCDVMSIQRTLRANQTILPNNSYGKV